MDHHALPTPSGPAPHPAVTSHPGAPPHAVAPYPAPYPAQYPAPGGGPAPLAGWWSRVGAFLIDSLLQMVPYLAGGLIGLAAGRPVVDELGRTSREFTTVGMVSVLVGFAVTIGFAVWNRWLRQGRGGQSVGKQVLGIRLVSADTGRPVGALRAFGRDVAHLLDGFLYLGYLWPLWDPRKQTFADKIVGSVVVAVR